MALLPQHTLKERGYAGKIYQTDAVTTSALLKEGGADVDGTFLAATSLLVAERLPDSAPSKKPALT